MLCLSLINITEPVIVMYVINKHHRVCYFMSGIIIKFAESAFVMSVIIKKHHRVCYGQVCYYNCGTCHMASLFLPLPRTAASTICSSSSILVATFTQHLEFHPPSAHLLKLLRLYQVHSLQLSPTDKVGWPLEISPPADT